MNPKALSSLLLMSLVGCGVAASDSNNVAETDDTSASAIAGTSSSSSSGGIGHPITNACGNVGTAPTISTTGVVSPLALIGGTAPTGFNPATGRTVQGGIQYISGGAVRVDITTDGCTQINSVTLGSHTITTNPTNGYSYSVIDEVNTTAQHTMILWVFFPTIGDGSLEQLNVTVGRQGAFSAASFSVPIVHVKDVDPTLADAHVGISGTELYDELASALYSEFNGATNSVVEDGQRIYGYDPSSLVSYVDGTGVWISFTFKADASDFCDPTIKVTGAFVLDTNDPGNPGISVRWVDPIEANPDWGGCTVLADLPILGPATALAYALIGDDGAGGAVQKVLTQKITAALPSANAALLDGSTTSDGLLEVNVKTPVPSVNIQVPYDAYDLPARPTPFPAGQPVTLIATGLGMNDSIANQSGSLSSSPDGVPLASSATALDHEEAVVRSGALADSASPVGRLLAKTQTSNLVTPVIHRYDAGCSVVTPSAQLSGSSPTISFGVNDTAADARRLRGIGAPGYSVQVLFNTSNGACSSFGGTSVVSPVGITQ